jgi:hypothetical protein
MGGIWAKATCVLFSIAILLMAVGLASSLIYGVSPSGVCFPIGTAFLLLASFTAEKA